MQPSSWTRDTRSLFKRVHASVTGTEQHLIGWYNNDHMLYAHVITLLIHYIDVDVIQGASGLLYTVKLA